MLGKVTVSLLAISLQCGPLLLAQTADVNANDPTKTALVEELFRLTKPDRLMQQMLQQSRAAFASGAEQSFNAQVRKFDDPAKYRAAFQTLEDKIFALLTERLSWETLKPRMAAVYMETFSTEELQGIIAFYQSAAGQALLSKQPGLLAKCGAIGQEQVGNITPEIQKMMTDFIAELRGAHENGKPPAQP